MAVFLPVGGAFPSLVSSGENLVQACPGWMTVGPWSGFYWDFSSVPLELLSGGHGRRDELEHIEAW
jgi:hypothetical protein